MYFQSVSKLDTEIHHKNLTFNFESKVFIIKFVLCHTLCLLEDTFQYSLHNVQNIIFLRSFIVDHPQKLFIPPLLKESYFQFWCFRRARAQLIDGFDSSG